MRVATNLGELYVEDVGHGPPVVLWHSFLHHGGMWKAQVEALKGRYRLLVIDAPGHGRSPVVRRPFDLDACARAVAEVMDARGVRRAAVAGLSWGGMTAMAMALAMPSRVSALALFDTSARAEPRRRLAKYYAMGTAFRALGAVPALVDRIAPIMFAEETRRGDPRMVEAWRAYVSRLDGEAVWQGLRCVMSRRDRLSELRAVRVPTLVVVGERDVAQPFVESEAIARAIPGARLEIVAGAGHLSAVEKPREVAQLLGRFLDAHAAYEARVI
jgi:pimeloyl-ACP methyl ester carboxylesterase